MRPSNTVRTFTGRLGLAAMALTAILGLACGRSPGPDEAAEVVAAAPQAAATAPTPHPVASAASAPVETHVVAPVAPATRGEVSFSGDRAETERFIGYYHQFPLTPEQERIKVAALSAVPAPCCADNPLSTCCCPCNMAKAAWGMSAWLITEKGYGVEQVRQAAEDWLATANPVGFTGDSCYTGGCMRPMHDNGCGGMDERRLL